MKITKIRLDYQVNFWTKSRKGIQDPDMKQKYSREPCNKYGFDAF